MKHSEALSEMEDLAVTCQAQGNIGQARTLREQALETRRRVLGPEHPETLAAMHNLSVVLRVQGDFGGARTLAEEVLKASRRVHGPEHRDTVMVMENLSLLLLEQGDLGGASTLAEMAFDSCLKLFGPEHPETLTAMGNFAVTLRVQGNLSDARAFEEEVLEARLRLLGPEHLDTLTTMDELAVTLRSEGHLSEARTLEEEVLEARLRLLRPEHPDTITTMDNLALVLWAQGEFSRARTLAEQVLEMRRRLYGPAHLHTLTAMGHLAMTLRAQGDFDPARKLEEEVLEARERLIGPQHSDTLTALHNLALTLRAQGDLDGAERLEARRQALGPLPREGVATIGRESDLKTGTLCPVPWLQRYVRENGTISVCCYAQNDIVLRDDGKPFHILDNPSEEEIVNSLYMRTIKMQMMKAQWPDICVNCAIAEKAGGGFRIERLRLCNQEKFKEVVSQTSPDGTSPSVTTQVHYSLGNKCNLRCRSCGPWSSSKWIKETSLVLGDSVSPKAFMGREYEWYREDASWQNLLNNLPHMEVLHFSGGEPLMIPQMLRILERIVNAGESHHILLYYNTNVTIIPKEVRTLWPQFKGVELNCSIDGFDQVNDYIRNPSVWSEIDSNLTHLDDHFNEYGLSALRIGCVVQVLNILRLNELVDYVARKNFKHLNSIMLSPLHQPEHLNIRILPAELRQLSIERLRLVKQKFFSGRAQNRAHFHVNFDEIIRILNQQEIDDVESWRTEFRRVTRVLDESRGESLLEVVPELAPLMADLA